MTARYALYYAPAVGSALWQLGCAWLGRDPASNRQIPLAAVEGLESGRQRDIVRPAAHYGFHATLKAPITLKDGYTEEMLVAAMNEFAAERPAFRAPALTVARIGGFLALVLSGPSAAFGALADDLVRAFDPFREPENAEEMARRRTIHLTARQEAHLAQWGYPYVFEDHLFHMTLTTWLDEPETSHLEAHLRRHFAPVTAMPLWVSGISLFRQPSRDVPFTRIADIDLGRPR